MAYKRINNFRGFNRDYEDVYPKLFHTDIVYKIDCRDCEASYIGQTGRCLKTHINEHRNHINWNTTQHFVITELVINKILIGKISKYYRRKRYLIKD